MFRNLLIICMLMVFFVACSSTEGTETEEMTTTALAQEDSHDDHAEDEHDDHAEDEHDDHAEDEHDDHAEDEHDDHAEDEHDDHAEDGEHREHGAHEHGAAMFTVAWTGNELAIDLETPAYNVLGFEYVPSSESEKSLFDESVATLEAGDLMQFSPDAHCTLISAVVQTRLAEEEHEEAEDHEEHSDEEETHADIDVAYSVQCENPDELESLDVTALFTHFPNFEALQVQWISDTQQSATELTAEDAVLSFK